MFFKRKMIERLPAEGDTEFINRLNDDAQRSRELIWGLFLSLCVLVVAVVAFSYLSYRDSNAYDSANRRAANWKEKAEELDTTNKKLTSDLGVCNGKMGAFNSFSSEFSAVKGELAGLKQHCTGKTSYVQAKRKNVVITETREQHRSQQAVETKSGGDLTLRKTSPVFCRWLSNGSLRLKTAPLKELPEGTVVDTILKSNLRPGQTCSQWQEEQEAQKADLAPVKRSTLMK